MNVRHVTNLQKYLISLGVLGEYGCKIDKESIVLSFVCGLMVVIKGICYKNLYSSKYQKIFGNWNQWK